MPVFDLVIIGGGPAGITAAVYAARKKLDFLLITADIGGQAPWSGDIANYTGYNFVTGPELVSKFEEHLKQFPVNIKEGEFARSIDKKGDIFEIWTSRGAYEAKSVIIATGKRSRELNVPGEKEFKNKGLAYCATCDGPLFAGKDTAVIGGGNSALDAALQLVRYCTKVYIINNTERLGGDTVMKEQAEKAGNLEVLNSSKVLEVLGGKVVSGLKIEKVKDGNTEIVELKVQGVFVEIGLLPNSEFAALAGKNSAGEIVVNADCATGIPGIFAAGDVTNVAEKQIIIAAGEGAKAALAAFKYLLVSGKLSQ
ncbi:MAG: FAD-dependent oxidoreductase [Candidatus Firestonebacteria bacterium]